MRSARDPNPSNAPDRESTSDAKTTTDRGILIERRARGFFMRDQRGLTLIEVLLSMAILASMVLLTVGTTTSSFRMRNRTVDNFETYRATRQAVDRMTRELSMAFVVHPQATELLEQASQDTELRYRTIFEGSDREITFTTMGHVARFDDEASSGQAEITYRIDGQRGDDGRIHDNLVRREDAPIDGKPEDGGYIYTVLRDVERVKFEYWDGDTEIAGDAWESSWDAFENQADPSLPDRVRITIEVKHPHAKNRTIKFTGVADIIIQEPLKILPTDLVQAYEDQQDTAEQQLLEAQEAGAGQEALPR